MKDELLNTHIQRFNASTAGTTRWRLWDAFWDDLNLQNHSVLPSLGRRDGLKGTKCVYPPPPWLRSCRGNEPIAISFMTCLRPQPTPNNRQPLPKPSELIRVLKK